MPVLRNAEEPLDAAGPTTVVRDGTHEVVGELCGNAGYDIEDPAEISLYLPGTPPEDAARVADEWVGWVQGAVGGRALHPLADWVEVGPPVPEWDRELGSSALASATVTATMSYFSPFASG
jgi:hypothetical protein